jgi:hypothetical protein
LRRRRSAGDHAERIRSQVAAISLGLGSPQPFRHSIGSAFRPIADPVFDKSRISHS